MSDPHPQSDLTRTLAAMAAGDWDALARFYGHSPNLLDQHENLSRELVLTPPRDSIRSAALLRAYARAVIAAILEAGAKADG